MKIKSVKTKNIFDKRNQQIESMIQNITTKINENKSLELARSDPRSAAQT